MYCSNCGAKLNNQNPTPVVYKRRTPTGLGVIKSIFNLIGWLIFLVLILLGVLLLCI